jgi:hypothetical protein
VRRVVLALALVLGCEERILPATTLSITPGEVSFGAVAVGASARRVVTVRNSGVAAVVVRGVEIGPELGDELRVVGVPERIAGDTVREVVLVYAPRSPGRRAGQVRILGDNGASSALSVSALAVADVVTFEPPAVDFGLAVVGKPVFADVQVVMRRASQLDLATVTVVGDLDFTARADLPAALGPASPVPVSVTLVATRSGPLYAELFVGDGRSVFGPVPIRATGLPAEVVVEPADSVLGAVFVGDSKPHTVALSSRGAARAEVEVIGRGDLEAYVGLAALLGPHTLEPGESLSFPLLFAPRRAGTSSVTLGLRVGGAELPVGRLVGEGVADPQASLAFAPTTLDLGAIQVDSPHPRAVWLENQASVSVDAPGVPTINAPGAEATLEVVGGPWPVLEAGGRQRWTLTLVPRVLGPGRVDIAVAGARLEVQYRAVEASVAAVAAPSRVELGPLTGVEAVDRRVLTLHSVGSASAVVTASIGGPDAARVYLGLPGVLAPGETALLPVGVLGTAPVRATVRLMPLGVGTATVVVALEGGPVTPRAGVPELCVAAAVPGVELHLVPLDATIRDVPRAASACSPVARDSAGSTWVVGAPFGQEACALRLTGSPDDGGALAVMVTTSPELRAPVQVSVFLRGFTPLATRTMGAGQRWQVGHTEGDRVVVTDAPLGDDDDVGCY